MPSVTEYLKSKYGFYITSDERNVNVTGTVTRILGNNPRRVAWMICNRSTTPVSLSFKEETPYADGLLIPGYGSVVSMDVEEDGEAVIYPVYGRVDTGTARLWVWEAMQT
jgi:hypothetical protein